MPEDLTLTWGVYGDNLVPLIELNDQDTWTNLQGCVLLLAKPEESNKAQARMRRPHRSVPERRQFNLEAIVKFALQQDYFNEDNDRFDEPEDAADDE